MKGSPTTFSDPAKHVDGNVDVSTTIACNSCHGSATNDAPPKDTTNHTQGRSAASVRTRRTSRRRRGTPTRRASSATSCRRPSTRSGTSIPLPAELTFTGLATGSTWNGTTCTSYCHGDSLVGGTALTPQWTKVDGTQKTCTSCHGNPPPLPHPQNADCGMCHEDVMAGAPTTFADRTRHIDGTLDVTLAVPCNKCHGGANNAPPKDTSGNTLTTARGVGAHQAHVAASTWHKVTTCNQCHRVPTTIDD